MNKLIKMICATCTLVLVNTSTTLLADSSNFAGPYVAFTAGSFGAQVSGEENLLDSAKRYLVQEKADWNTAFKSAAQSRPAMKYKDAVGFIDTAGLNSMEKRSALKAAKKWLR